jgi:hypothetical protein
MIRQFGVVAWKAAPDGAPQVLLVTSRDTGRWVVPRGNPVPGLPPHLSAAQEAYEEAGVRGPVTSLVVGGYGYRKTRRSGLGVRAHVTLFALAVEEELGDWPEASERTRRWFSPAEAAEAVVEPELKALLRAFVPPL